MFIDKKMKKFEYSITGNDVVPQNMIGGIFLGHPVRALGCLLEGMLLSGIIICRNLSNRLVVNNVWFTSLFNLKYLSSSNNSMPLLSTGILEIGYHEKIVTHICINRVNTIYDVLFRD